MSEKLSRIILSVEAVLIVLPFIWVAGIKTLLIIFTVSDLLNVAKEFSITILIILMILASWWRLFIAFIRGGSSNLHKQHLGWWLALLAGAVILIGCLISNFLPRSPAYSRMDAFRFELESFWGAKRLLIPTIHLALEKFLRKPTGETAPSAHQEIHK